MIRYIVIIVLNILDLLLTYIGIEKVDGIRETNPLANFIIQHGWEYAWLHKAIGVTFIIYLLRKTGDEKKACSEAKPLLDAEWSCEDLEVYFDQSTISGETQ